MNFELHHALAKKDFVCDLSFCKVLLEDNKDYPWVFLVPKKNNVRNMLDLTSEERIILTKEIEVVEKTMFELFSPTQTNVAMIGNVTPQLHVHIICRFEGDPLWPLTIWGTKSTPYEPNKRNEIITKIRNALEKK